VVVLVVALVLLVLLLLLLLLLPPPPLLLPPLPAGPSWRNIWATGMITSCGQQEGISDGWPGWDCER
jgi:hypothetical protein